MAHFISTSGASISCYDGTRCSGKSSAELTNEVFIGKARRNPAFTEVGAEIKATRKKRVAKKKATKKKAK